jgi:actin
VSSADKEIVRDIKEKTGYCALNLKEEEFNSMDVKYELPDGEIISVGKERFQCCEILFEPQLMHLNEVGIHQMTYDSIMSCAIDTRKDLYSNIILCGGSTMFNDFAERFHQEMTELAPNASAKIIRIVAPPERKYSVWIGGSILASLTRFEEMWISKEEYQENGVR